MRRMRTVVLPLPAPASISTGPVRVLAAWRCMGLRVPRFRSNIFAFRAKNSCRWFSVIV